MWPSCTEWECMGCSWGRRLLPSPYHKQTGTPQPFSLLCTIAIAIAIVICAMAARGGCTPRYNSLPAMGIPSRHRLRKYQTRRGRGKAANAMAPGNGKLQQNAKKCKKMQLLGKSKKCKKMQKMQVAFSPLPCLRSGGRHTWARSVASTPPPHCTHPPGYNESFARPPALPHDAPGGHGMCGAGGGQQ